MPQVELIRPIEVGPTGGSELTVTNLGSRNAFYGTSATVSATNKTGTLNVGESLTLTKGTVWLVAEATPVVLNLREQVGISVASGAAILGTDGTVGGPGGSPLTGPVISSSTAAAYVDSYLAISANVPAAIEAAITAATNGGTTGGYVRFKAGSTYEYAAGSPPKIPRALPSMLTIDVRGATIRLSEAVPRAFDPGKIADYDTIQHCTIEGGTYSGGGFTTANNIIFGIWQVGKWLPRLNLEDIHIKDVEIIEAPVTSILNIGVALSASNKIADTECRVVNCSVERISAPDGSCLQLVDVEGAPQPTETIANTWHDVIKVSGVYHPMTAVPTEAHSGGHVNAATKGRGGQILIEWVNGKNSPDVGIECDSFMDANIQNCFVKDSYNFDYYHVNYREPLDLEAQQLTYTNCTARKEEVLHGTGWGIGNSATQAVRPAAVHFGEGCKYYRTKAGENPTAHEGLTVNGSRRITGELTSIIEIGTWNSETSIFPVAVLINAPDNTARTAINFKLKSVVTGEGTAGKAGTINFRPFVLREGRFTDFDIDIDSDVKIVSAGNATINHADMGSVEETGSEKEASCIMSGRLRVTVPTTGGLEGNTPTGIRFETGVFNEIPTEILVWGCDFAGLGTTSSNVEFAGATGHKLSGKVRFRDNRWRSYPQERRATAVSLTPADGTADTIAVTNTAAERVIEWPRAAEVYPGVIYTVKDESGTVTGANKIVWTLAGAETFLDGKSSQEIREPYGQVQAYSNGTKWVALGTPGAWLLATGTTAGITLGAHIEEGGAKDVAIRSEGMRAWLRGVLTAESGKEVAAAGTVATLPEALWPLNQQQLTVSQLNAAGTVVTGNVLKISTVGVCTIAVALKSLEALLWDNWSYPLS